MYAVLLMYFVIAGTTIRIIFEHFASNRHNGFLEDCTVTQLIRLMVQMPLEKKNIGERY